MYEQRRRLGADERAWPHRIIGGRRVLGVDETDGALRVRVGMAPTTGAVEQDESVGGGEEGEEVLEADLIIAATGYGRSVHVDMLRDAWPLLPEVADKGELAGGYERRDRWLVETSGDAEGEAPKTRAIEVGRDYGVRFSPGMVAPGSGIWLQGCCESTHGVSLHAPFLLTHPTSTDSGKLTRVKKTQLSDTLLSVLATRSGEIVESIFGKGPAGKKGAAC